MNCWLSCKVSALKSVVAGSISCGGDHGIYCWWDLTTSKQRSSVSVSCAQMFPEFSGHGNSIHNIIPLLNKTNIHYSNYYSSITMSWTREEKCFTWLLIWRQKSFKTISELMQLINTEMIYPWDKKLKKFACFCSWYNNN